MGDAAAAPATEPIAEDAPATAPDGSPNPDADSQPQADGQDAGAPDGNEATLQEEWEMVNDQAGTPSKGDDPTPPNPTEGAPLPASTPPATGKRCVQN